MSLYISWICHIVIIIYPEPRGIDCTAAVSLCNRDTVCLLHSACLLLLLADILALSFHSLFVLHCVLVSFRKPLPISYHSARCLLHQSFSYATASPVFSWSSRIRGCTAAALLQLATNETCTHYFKCRLAQNTKLSLTKKLNSTLAVSLTLLVNLTQ